MVVEKGVSVGEGMCVPGLACSSGEEEKSETSKGNLCDLELQSCTYCNLFS